MTCTAARVCLPLALNSWCGLSSLRWNRNGSCYLWLKSSQGGKVLISHFEESYLLSVPLVNRTNTTASFLLMMQLRVDWLGMSHNVIEHRNTLCCVVYGRPAGLMLSLNLLTKSVLSTNFEFSLTQFMTLYIGSKQVFGTSTWLIDRQTNYVLILTLAWACI